MFTIFNLTWMTIGVKDDFIEEFLVFIRVGLLIELDLFFGSVDDIICCVIGFDGAFNFVEGMLELGLDLKGGEWEFGVGLDMLGFFENVNVLVLFFVDVGFDDGGFGFGSWWGALLSGLLAEFHMF